MPFKNEIYHAPAERGNIAGPILTTTIALSIVREALRKIAAKADVDISSELAQLNDEMKKLDQSFDELSGWYKE